jgi:hypothetical protein
MQHNGERHHEAVGNITPDDGCYTLPEGIMECLETLKAETTARCQRRNTETLRHLATG